MRKYSSAVVAVALAALACGGGQTEADARVDAGRSPLCPAVPPLVGSACDEVNLECSYTSDDENCGAYRCAAGAWSASGVGIQCALPSGFACPTVKAPRLVAPQAVARTCVADADCAFVPFQTDCCGNTFGYGVSTASVSAAKAEASTCRRSFAGCGCPAAKPSLPETPLPDAGVTSTIEAYCDAGTCRTRYALP